MSNLIPTRANRLAMTSRNSSPLRKESMVDAKSALGHERRFCGVHDESGLPSTAERLMQGKTEVDGQQQPME